MPGGHPGKTGGEASNSVERFGAEVSAALQAHAECVDCAYFFGSAARGQAGTLSDLDVGVLFSDSVAPRKRWEIAAALVAQLQRLEGPGIDIVVLNDAAPALQYRVVREGRPVFVRDDRRRIAFESQAMREFLDFQPVLEVYDKYLIRRAREGRFGR